MKRGHFGERKNADGLRELDLRKEKILQVITDDYIESAEPVGSRTIAKKYNLGLSPATIRNEMSDLEESGYLKQPHTSAGRIPSHQGYRYYVDALMHERPLTQDELEAIRNEFEAKTKRIDSLLQQTVKVLSQLTKFPSIILTPKLQVATFKYIQLVPINDYHLLVLVVTDAGFIENKLIETPFPIHEEELQRISSMLNKKLQGVSLRNLGSTLLREIKEEMLAHDKFFHETMQLLVKTLETKEKERVYLEGAVNILEQPEFKEVEKLKPIMMMLETEEKLYNILADSSLQHGIRICIGEENPEEAAHQCSVVTATYEVGGRTLGAIGVLGPTRMDYARVVSVVDFVSNYLSDLLTDLSKNR